MAFEDLSDEEVAELKRMRPVTREEYDDMVDVLFDNRQDYLEFHRRQGVDQEELAARERASAVVLGRYLARLRRDYAKTGQASRWLLEKSKFAGDCRRETVKQRCINHQKPESHPAPKTGGDTPADPAAPAETASPQVEDKPRVHDVPLGDDTFIIDATPFDPDGGLVRRSNDPATQVINKLAPTVTALIPVILRVLGSRTGDSSLSPRQVEAVQCLVISIQGRHTTPPHLRPKLSAFQTNMDTFRSDLARLWHAEDTGQPVPVSSGPDFKPTSSQQSAVTSALQRATRLLRVCLYLFITLAPPHQAVVCREDMHALLDLVYHEGRLPASDRRLLRRAGETLRAASPWEVDEEKLYETARKLKMFAGANLYSLVAQLHGAEERYAGLVPGQRFHPPRFQCVMRCQAHCVEGD